MLPFYEENLANSGVRPFVATHRSWREIVLIQTHSMRGPATANPASTMPLAPRDPDPVRNGFGNMRFHTGRAGALY